MGKHLYPDMDYQEEVYYKLVAYYQGRDMNKYDCCGKCYIQFVEGREERWSNLTERVEFLAAYYNQGEK